MRGRISAVLAGVVVVLLAGCTATITGTARKAPYRPIPLDSVTARMADPVDGAVAYSRDGTLVVTKTETRLCIGPVSRSDAQHRVCADPGAPTSQVLISPDGATVAALENIAKTYRGGLWLISAGNGTVRQVPSLDERGTGTGSAPATTGTTEPDGTSGSSSMSYTSIAWASGGSLLAVANSADGTHLVKVDPASGGPEDLGRVLPGDGLAGGTLLTAGDIAVVPVGAVSGTPKLVVFNLADRKARTVTLTGKMITNDTQAMPLALAPNGRSAVLWMSDPATFTELPPVRADLDTGRLTVIAGTDGLMLSAAAYSPDSSQLAIAGRTKYGHTDYLALLPAGGGTPHTVTTLGSVPPGVGLDWTSSNLLVPQLMPGLVSLGGLAPVQLAG